MQWYNRSIGIDLSKDLAIVYLAIAFESLLGLDQGKGVSERFKEAVTLLVGRIPRLDSWLDQFYEARSGIVHDGSFKTLSFHASDRGKNKEFPSEYRSLVSYGRLIFDICLESLIAGARLTSKRCLASMFVTNQQRCEKIAKILNSSNNNHKGLTEVRQEIIDFENYCFVPEQLQNKILLGTAKIVACAYLHTNQSIREPLKKPLGALAVSNKEDKLVTLQAIKDANEELKGTRAAAHFMHDNDEALLSLFLDSIWKYLFPLYFSLERRRARLLEKAPSIEEE